MPQSTENFYALLIGVSAYHPDGGVASLRGCANDMAEMERLLKEKFGAPPSNIVTLVDELATHAAIKQAMQTHLIGRAQSWPSHSASHEQPAFLFYFSGHGSQTRDLTGQEPDGMDETIVPYDSRTPGVYDIRDWELGQMVESLGHASDNITVILDCCHSGSGTRKIDLGAVRNCPPDLRPQPFYRPLTGGQRSLSGAGWEIGRKHTLIAGCRDRELSNEMAIPDGEQEVWRGALSYFLQQEVQKMNPEAPLTYRELVERVRSQVAQRFENQTPQCEGDVNREFLGGLHPVRDRFFTVVEERAGLFWLDAGIAHGVRMGAVLSVYAPQTRTLAQAGEPLARMKVVEERISRSGCRRVGHGADSLLFGRAVMESAGVGSQVRTVRLAVDDADLKVKLSQRFAPLPADDPRVDVSPFVRVVTGAADFTLTLTDGQVAILDRAGAPCAKPYAADDVENVALALAHIARYLNALELRNDAPTSGLAGMATLEIQRLILDAQASRPNSAPITPQPGGEIVLESGERIVLMIRNRASRLLHVGLFSFGAGFGAGFEIIKLFPQGVGGQEALAAGRAHWLGRSARRSEQWEVYLPPGVGEARDIYKLIASAEEINFDLLVQAPLGAAFSAHKSVIGAAGQPPSALDLLLAQTAGLIRAKDAPLPTADAWTTAEIVVHVVANRAEATQLLIGGTVTQSAAFPISFHAPPDCDGRVRVLTQRQVQLFAGDLAALQPPPGFAAFPDLFQALDIGAIGGAAPGALVELELGESGRRRVSPETPLILELGWAPAADTAGVMALAWDGATYFPVGRAAGAARSMAVEWLPQPDLSVAQHASGDHSGAPSIKLILYRLLSRDLPRPGLHCVHPFPIREEIAATRRVAGAPLYYTLPARSAFAAGQRIALVIPELGAESGELAAWLHSRAAPTYEHILAFDYETPEVMENARQLLTALRSLRLDKTPGLRMDLFAQGAGALLARALLEFLKADAFIQRCFLIGPPNQGAPLADSTAWLPWLLSLALNQPVASPPWLAARWALGELSTSTAGPEDLRPQADLLGRLNRVRRPLGTAYFVLAGNVSASQVGEALGQRLARQLANTGHSLAGAVLGGRGDLVVPLESMVDMGSESARAAVAGTFVAPCNHLAYLDDPAAQEQLAAWVSARL